MTKSISKGEYLEIPLDKIDPPHGIIRLEIPLERVVELADNIREQGLLQPILVRSCGKRYEIVAGHRRFLAFKHLSLPSIPARIVKMNDCSVALARASENLSRDDLSPLEEGAIYIDLRDTHNLTYDEIGKRMGKSPGVVKRRMDLLKMPPNLQKAVHLKQIGQTVAEELWSLGDEAAIDYYLGFAIDNGATKDVVRGWVKDWRNARRRSETAGEGTPSPPSPMESRPVWVTCDLCLGPMELGKETVIRCCPDCDKSLKEALK